MALATQIVDATPVPFTTAAELAPVVAQLIADGWTAAQIVDAATDPRLRGWTLKALRWARAQDGTNEPGRSYRDQRAACDRCAGAGAVFLADGTAAQCECTGAGPVPLVEASDPAPGTAAGVEAAREASSAARARRTGDTGTDASEAA